MPLMEYPVRKVRRPAFLRPEARRMSETMLSTSPIVFKSPCATPIRLDPPVRYRQSESPVAAAPNAPRVPNRSEASAACCRGFLPVARSRPSKTSAVVQAPMGTSVITGCNGASNQTPSSTLRAVVPPASTAFCTSGCTASETLSRKGNASTMRCIRVRAISSAFPLVITGTLYPNGNDATRPQNPLFSLSPLADDGRLFRRGQKGEPVRDQNVQIQCHRQRGHDRVLLVPEQGTLRRYGL